MSQFQWLADNHGEEYRAVRFIVFLLLFTFQVTLCGQNYLAISLPWNSGVYTFHYHRYINSSSCSLLFANISESVVL